MSEELIKRRFDLNVGVMILAGIFIFSILNHEPYMMYILNLAIINMIAVIGLNIVTGMAGQLNAGHVAFYGIGAYSSALLTLNLNLSFWMALPIAAIITSIFGIFLGIPSIRVGGKYLALVTLGFGEIMRLVFLNSKITKGYSGLTNIPIPSFFGYRFSDANSYFYLVFCILIVCFFVSIKIRYSPLGRAFISINEDQLASESFGINSAMIKITAFCFAGLFGGLAGSLYAHMLKYVSPDGFIFEGSILFLTMVIVGGLGTIAGPLVGGALLTFLPEFLRMFGSFRLIFYGFFILFFVIVMPRGIIGRFANIYAKLKIKKLDSLNVKT